MAMKSPHGAGLFLAAFAAFALAAGVPQIVLAAPPQADLADVESLIETEEGKAALDKAGVSAEEFKTMLSKLSPERRAEIENMVRDITPKARLTAEMKAAGYTQEEVDERLSVLSDDEIAKLSASPDATAGGTSVATVVLIALLVFMAVLVAWYFVAVEDPEGGGPAEPAPAPAE